MEPEKYLISRMHPLSDLERERVEANQGLIGAVIRDKYLSYLGKPRRNGEGPISYADLMGAGQFGLIEAAARFDPLRGAFSTCAEMWIKNKIRRYIREYGELIRIPKWVVHAKPERDGEAKTAREKARVLKVRNVQPINEALDHAHVDRDTRRTGIRRMLLRLAYSVVAETDEMMLGRVLFIKMAGAGGDTPGLGDVERVGEIAQSLGIQRARARMAYESFLSAMRTRVVELELGYPV